MAQNLRIAGATYEDVPSIRIPNASGGTAQFIDAENVITVYVGTNTPSESLGSDGDIYIKVEG